MLDKYKEFKESRQDIIDHYFDGNNPNALADPATQKQIAMVYALLGNMGYGKYEKEDFAEETGFHHMSKGEISNLISELLGEDKKKKNKYINSNDKIFKSNSHDVDISGYDLF